MGYDEIAKKATLKYRRNKQHPVTISYKTEEFEQEVLPYIEKSGAKVATFFKDAVKEKIQRDFPDGLEQNEAGDTSAREGTVRSAVQKYLHDDKKTVLYVTVGETMYTYVKADGAKYTWEDAMRDYGNREYDSISDDAYVVEIRCKEIQDA